MTTQTHVHTSAEEVHALAHRKRSGKDIAVLVGGIIGMAVIVIYCLAPFYWMIVSSLRLPTMGRSTDFIPNPVSFANYAGVFDPSNNFGRAIINSIIVSTVVTVLTLLFGILAAYALARLRFRFKG